MNYEIELPLARRKSEGEGQHYDEEAQHEQRRVNDAYYLPAVEPYLAAPAEVCIALQKPWERWNQMAASHTM